MKSQRYVDTALQRNLRSRYRNMPTSTLNRVCQGAAAAVVGMGSLVIGIGMPSQAIALPIEIPVPMPTDSAVESSVMSQRVAQQPTQDSGQQAVPEIDSSITREYRPVTVYIPDPNTQELVPQSVLVSVDEPAEIAVDQIIQAYEGQDVGIAGYEVNVDSTKREAEVNFEVDSPRGADAMQSLSSANQYSLFEAIRATLLTEPTYGVDEVIFMANDVSFDI
ncbi:MAG: hypothetical protein KME20_11055 [Kaiparowitsia implicata GSE-PSE-MK54-09C]|jgi:hypothetical protein|nr:hypothetical protein [Kaiparowitsia implicata GSE-PSE-MK54-09C]